MLVNIPASRKRVVAVSFPRDLAITPMNCQAWDPETGKYGPVYDKNTGEWSDNERSHDHEAQFRLRPGRSQVSGEGDPEALRAGDQPVHGGRLRRILEDGRRRSAASRCAAPPRWRTPNWGRFWPPRAGRNSTGHTALNYVRARSIATEDNGDYGRIKRQQLFLSSLLRSMISTETLFDYSTSSTTWSTCSSTTPTSTTSKPATWWTGPVTAGHQRRTDHLRDGSHHRAFRRRRQRGTADRGYPRPVRRDHRRRSAARRERQQRDPQPA